MSTWYHYLSKPFCPYFGVQVKKTKAHECMKPSPSNTNGKSKNGYSNWAYGIIILRGMCRSFGVQVSQKKKGKSKNSEAMGSCNDNALKHVQVFERCKSHKIRN